METRQVPRINLNLKTVSKIADSAEQKFSLPGGNQFEAEIVDISLGGLGIRVRYFLPKGLIVDLELEGASFGLQETMRIRGEVRYCKNIEPRLYKCGIKFLNISKKYQEAITKLFSSCERRKEPRLKLAQ